MSNIFLSELAKRNAACATTAKHVPKPAVESHDDAGVAVPGENDQPEDLIQAEAAVGDVEAVITDRQETEVEVAGTDVAVEAIRHTMSTSLRTAFALEELAEQLEQTIEGDGEGVSPATAQMLTTAIEPAIGDDVPAVESFNANSRFATESMIDTVKDKAKGYMATVVNTVNSVTSATSQWLRTVTDNMRNTQKVLTDMKTKIGALDGHSGKAITDEATLKHLNRQLSMHVTGKSGDGAAMVVGVLTKSVPALVNGANAMYDALSGLVSALESPDEKTLSREAKRFYDMARRFVSNMPAKDTVKLVVPESYDLATLSSPETAKATIDYNDKGNAENNFTFKIIDSGMFDKLESAINHSADALNGLTASTSKKAQLGNSLIAAGKGKVAEGEEENSVQLRRAVANVLVGANMLCRDAARACGQAAHSGEKCALMIVRASLRAAGIETKAAAAAAKQAPAADAAAA